MKVIIADSTMKYAWESYVEERPTIAWQTWEWANVVKKHYKVKFFPIAAVNNMEICGILPLYQLDTIFNKNVLISV